MTIKEYLRETGLSQVEFARISKTTPIQISWYIRDIKEPELRIAKRLVEASGGKITLEGIYGIRKKEIKFY